MYLTASATNPVQPDDLETVVGESDSNHGHLVASVSQEEITILLELSEPRVTVMTTFLNLQK